MAWSQSAALHDVAPRRARAHRDPPLGSERRGSRRPAGPCAVAPPFLPAPLAPRASHPWAAVPPYPRRAAQPTARRRTRRTSPPPIRAVPLPCRGPYLVQFQLGAQAVASTALCTAIKPASPSSRGRRAVAVRHGRLTVNSTPACFSSPACVASHFVGPPYSSCTRLLVCSNCQLARGISPAAAAG
jgi:hypothetical protein